MLLDDLLGIDEEHIKVLLAKTDEELTELWADYLPMIREPRLKKKKLKREGVVEVQVPENVQRKLAEDELRAMCPELFT